MKHKHREGFHFLIGVNASIPYLALAFPLTATADTVYFVGGIGPGGEFSPSLINKLHLPNLTHTPVEQGGAFVAGNNGLADGGPSRVLPALHYAQLQSDQSTLVMVGNNTAGDGSIGNKEYARPDDREAEVQVHSLVPAPASSRSRAGAGGMHWTPVKTDMSNQVLVGNEVKTVSDRPAPPARIGASMAARKHRVFYCFGRGPASAASTTTVEGAMIDAPSGAGAGGSGRGKKHASAASAVAVEPIYFADFGYITWKGSDGPLEAKWKVFSPSTNPQRWPSPRAFASMTILDDKCRIALHGGHNESGSLNDLHVVRLSAGVVMEQPALSGHMLRGRSNPMTAVVGAESMLIWGGKTELPARAGSTAAGSAMNTSTSAGAAAAARPPSIGFNELALTMVQFSADYTEGVVTELGEGFPGDGESDLASVPTAAAVGGTSRGSVLGLRGHPLERSFDPPPPARRWGAQVVQLPDTLITSASPSGSKLAKIVHERFKAFGRNIMELGGGSGGGAAAEGGGGKRARTGAGAGSSSNPAPYSDEWARSIISQSQFILMYGGMVGNNKGGLSKVTDDIHLLCVTPAEAWPQVPPLPAPPRQGGGNRQQQAAAAAAVAAPAARASPPLPDRVPVQQVQLQPAIGVAPFSAAAPAAAASSSSAASGAAVVGAINIDPRPHVEALIAFLQTFDGGGGGGGGMPSPVHRYDAQRGISGASASTGGVANGIGSLSAAQFISSAAFQNAIQTAVSNALHSSGVSSTSSAVSSNDVSALRDQLRGLKSEVERMKERVDDARDDGKKLLGLLQDMKEQGAASQSVDSRMGKVLQAVSELQSVVTASTNRLAGIQSQLDKEVKQAKDEADVAIRAHAKISQQLAEAVSARERLQADLERERQAVATQRDRAVSAETKAKQLEQEHDQLRQRASALEQEVAQARNRELTASARAEEAERRLKVIMQAAMPSGGGGGGGGGGGAGAGK